MSDVALARTLVSEIAGHAWHGKGDMIDRVHAAIARHFPHWTRRRVRSLWHREAAGVRYHEMVELAEVAAAEKAERARIEEARHDHAEYVARAARLATALAVQDEDFHRDYAAVLRDMAGEQARSSKRDDARQGHIHPDPLGRVRPMDRAGDFRR